MVLFTVWLAWQAPLYDIVARLLTGPRTACSRLIHHRDKVCAKEKSGFIAIMFGGLTVASSHGRAAGNIYRSAFYGVRPFLAVSLLGVIALMSSQPLIPANIPGRAVASILADRAESTDSSSSVTDLRRYGVGHGGYSRHSPPAPMMRIRRIPAKCRDSLSARRIGYRQYLGAVNRDKHGAAGSGNLFRAVSVPLMVFQTVSTQHAALATNSGVMGILPSVTYRRRSTWQQKAEHHAHGDGVRPEHCGV